MNDELRKAYIHTFALIWRVSDEKAEEAYGDIVDELIEVARARGWRKVETSPIIDDRRR